MFARTLIVGLALLLTAGCAAMIPASSGAAPQWQRQMVDDVPAIMRKIKPGGAGLRAAS